MNCRLICDDMLNLRKYVEKSSAKLVFIDPPFNTGQNFHDYSDKRTFAEWYSLISDSIEICYQVLRSDGSIWINVDDRYSHYVRLSLDNFSVLSVMWPQSLGSISIKLGPVEQFMLHIIQLLFMERNQGGDVVMESNHWKNKLRNIGIQIMTRRDVGG